MRKLSHALLLLALALASAACDVQPPPTATPIPLPTLIPTPYLETRRYTGEGFAIDYPAGWIATRSGQGEALFRPGDGSNTLGMSVHTLKATGADADALLDAHRSQVLASVPDAAYSEDRMDAPGGGRSDFYQDWRAEPRLQYQVTIYIQDGRAFRVVQWAPVVEWDRLWYNFFARMLAGFEAIG